MHQKHKIIAYSIQHNSRKEKGNMISIYRNIYMKSHLIYFMFGMFLATVVFLFVPFILQMKLGYKIYIFASHRVCIGKHLYKIYEFMQTHFILCTYVNVIEYEQKIFSFTSVNDEIFVIDLMNLLIGIRHVNI